MKYLLLVLLLIEVAAHAQTEWPAGEGICRGRWTFDRYPAGRHSEHGIEKKVCRENDLCKKNTCCMYIYNKKRTKHVGEASTQTSYRLGTRIDDEDAINTSDDPVYGGRVAGTEQCRTGDDLYVKNREQGHIKFSYLKKIYITIKVTAETSEDEYIPEVREYRAIQDTYETMFTHHSDLLTPSQQRWILNELGHPQ